MRDRDPRPRSDPPTLILTSLSGGAKHGYALLRDIEQFAGVRLGPGTLYGAISRLEERGFIEALGPSGRQRPYRLTDAGLGALRATLADLQAVVETGQARLGTAVRPRPELADGVA